MRTNTWLLLSANRLLTAALANPLNQYAFKYWLGMTGTVVVITAIMWKVRPVGCC